MEQSQREFGASLPALRRLDRQPGQKESRYEQLLTKGAVGAAPVEAESPAAVPAEVESIAPPAAAPGELEDLRADLDDLKRRFDELLYRLGEEID